LLRGSIFREENALQMPEVSVNIVRAGIPAPPHPSAREKGGGGEKEGGGGGGLLGSMLNKLKEVQNKEDDLQGIVFLIVRACACLCIHTTCLYVISKSL
jgi:hypothetical protein